MSASGSEPKRTEVNLTRIIADEYWTASILGTTGRLSQDQHAFLVLEGTSENMSMIWFVEFDSYITF